MYIIRGCPGKSIGHLNHGKADHPVAQAEALLEYLGVREPLGDLLQVPPACEAALRRKGEREYLLVLNYGKEPQELLLKRPMVDLDDRCPVEGPVVLGSYETKVYRIGG